MGKRQDKSRSARRGVTRRGFLGTAGAGAVDPAIAIPVEGKKLAIKDLEQLQRSQVALATGYRRCTPSVP